MTAQRRYTVRLAATIGIVAGGLAAGPVPGAGADADLTITPLQQMLNPAGAADPLTDASTPSFSIQGPMGTFSCSVSNGIDAENGSANPSCVASPCAAGSCAIVRLDPVNDDRYLDVQDDQSDGNTSNTDYAFEQDVTPPGLSVTFAAPDVPADAPHAANYGSPAMDVDVNEDAGEERHTAQCSLTTGATPHWVACRSENASDPEERSFAESLPTSKRHIDYTFEARAFDVFGRASPTVVSHFDPQPCVLRAVHESLAALFHHGAGAALSCDQAGGGYELSAFLFRLNGHLIGGASESETLALGTDMNKSIHDSAAQFSSRAYVHLDSYARRHIPHARSATLALEVTPLGWGHVSVTTITVRR